MRISPTYPRIFGVTSAVAAIVTAVIVTSCGKSNSTGTALLQQQTQFPTQPYPGTVPGSTCFQGFAACATGTQFEGTCRYVGGYITNRYGPSVCTLTRRYSYQYNPTLTLYYPNALPIVTPSIPSGGGANTGIRLRKGATLRYFPVRNGKWGYIKESTDSFWGGRISFSWFKYNCQSVDWDGNGGQITNEGQPSGLFGSDGTTSFLLGSSSRNVSIANDGYLILGINADPSTPYGCTSVGATEFDLTTCEDANGNSYNCAS
jgi:hypothetical protein